MAGGVSDRLSCLWAGLGAALKVATPYSLYVCPEGQNVTLTCRILGPGAKGHNVSIYKTWYRSLRGEVQACSKRQPIRNLTSQDLHLYHHAHQLTGGNQSLARRHGLLPAADHHGNFSITVHGLTAQDSGLYCCLVVEIWHHHSEQRVHGAMELQVQRGEGCAGPLRVSSGDCASDRGGCGVTVEPGFLPAARGCRAPETSHLPLSPLFWARGAAIETSLGSAAGSGGWWGERGNV